MTNAPVLRMLVKPALEFVCGEWQASYREFGITASGDTREEAIERLLVARLGKMQNPEFLARVIERMISGDEVVSSMARVAYKNRVLQLMSDDNADVSFIGSQERSSGDGAASI